MGELSVKDSPEPYFGLRPLRVAVNRSFERRLDKGDLASEDDGNKRPLAAEDSEPVSQVG